MRVSARAWAWIVAAIVLGLGVAVVQRSLEGSHDFDGFHAAARHVLNTGTLSTDKNVTRYPPTFQALHLPLGWLPLGVASALWYLLSIAALFDLPRRIEALGGVAPRDQRVAWISMLPFVVDNLVLGQSGPVLLWLSTWALARMRTGGAFVGGLGIGLGAAMKVLPALHLVVPVVMGRDWARRRAALLGALLSVALLFGAVVLATDGEQALAGTTRWVTLTRAEQTPWSLVAHNRSLRYNNQGLGVTLARTVADIAPAEAKGRVALASFPLAVAWWLLAGLWAALALVGALGLAAARRLATPQAWLSAFALAALACLFVSPIVWTHYFMWMLPALVALRTRRRLLAVVGTVLWIGLAVVPLRGLGLHMFGAMGLYALVTADLVRAARSLQPPATASAARDQPPSPPEAAGAAPSC